MARILLVDDNEELLELTALVLRGANYSVAAAANGKEALKLLADNEFDLVLTDVVMPEKEGIETIMEIRKKFPEIKIIAMSGGGAAAPEEYLVVARMLGAAKSLAKPFTGEQLLSTVSSVLGE